MMKKANFLYLLPLLCLSLINCGDPEAELQRIRQEQHEAQIKLDPAQSEGKCRNDENKRHLFAENIRFAKDMETCVIKDIRFPDLWNSSAHLNKERFASLYPDMSEGCIDCFAQLTKCTADNCKGACYSDAADADCETCSRRSCHEAMIKCSGVLSEELPRLHKD